MVASSRLLEARTITVENQEADRRGQKSTECTRGRGEAFECSLVARLCATQ